MSWREESTFKASSQLRDEEKEFLKAAKKSEEAVKREAAKLTKEEEKTKAAAVAERAAAAVEQSERDQHLMEELHQQLAEQLSRKSGPPLRSAARALA